ncbi:ThiF family adenylyltransferase [Streptomyces tanashiensis]|uniref:ThiF family adenylyltransferase n=1 Tax=Streptomyces tanashiensis TaxID=67367 RepID=UPI0033F591C3
MATATWRRSSAPWTRPAPDGRPRRRRRCGDRARSGGIGSAVAPSLVVSGLGRVRVRDHDAVELTSLKRQFTFDEDDVGRRTTEVAVDRLSRPNTDVTVTGEERLLTGPDDIADAVSGSDLFLLCAGGRNNALLQAEG